MVLHSEDNPPLEITGVKAQGDVYRVVFLAQEGKTYRAGLRFARRRGPTLRHVGRAGAGAIGGNQPVEAKLGRATTTRHFARAQRSRAGTRSTARCFWSARSCRWWVCWVAALARAGRRIEQIPEE